MKSSVDLKEVGKRLKKVRKALGLSQDELSEQINLSVTTLSENENGKSRPGFDYLHRMADKFDVNIYYILLGQGEIFRSKEGSRDNGNNFNFDGEDQDLQEFLWYLSRSKYVRFNILGLFRKFYNQEEEAIKFDLHRGEGVNGRRNSK